MYVKASHSSTKTRACATTDAAGPSSHTATDSVLETVATQTNSSGIEVLSNDLNSLW